MSGKGDDERRSPARVRSTRGRGRSGLGRRSEGMGGLGKDPHAGVDPTPLICERRSSIEESCRLRTRSSVCTASACLKPCLQGPRAGSHRPATRVRMDSWVCRRCHGASWHSRRRRGWCDPRACPGVELSPDRRLRHRGRRDPHWSTRFGRRPRVCRLLIAGQAHPTSRQKLNVLVSPESHGQNNFHDRRVGSTLSGSRACPSR